MVTGLSAQTWGKCEKGVFATRSPFRPNSIGLSCVKLEKVALDESDMTCTLCRRCRSDEWNTDFRY